LLRTDRQAEAESALQQFRKLEAEERDREYSMRGIRIVIQSAIDRFDRGEVEEAFAELREGIRSYPNSGLIRLNLGVLQSRLGRHLDAIKTLEAMIGEGFGDHFLVHLNLSQQYEILGQKAAGQRYRVNYLQQYAVALRNGLP
jgi:tetratricopeptide (TPR) repeat protein